MKVSKRLAIMAAAVGAGVGFGSQARAATYYWDVDAGAGFGTGSGTVSWLTNNWTTDATGAAAVGAWAQGNDAVFDAGSGAYTVAPSTATPIVANGLYFQQGTVSLILATASDNPGLHLRNGIAVPTVSVASGAVGLINTYKVVAPIGFNKTGDGLLSFGGSSTVGNLDVRGAIGVKEGTLKAISTQFKTTAEAAVDLGATLDLNGFGGTVPIYGLSGAGTFTNQDSTKAAVALTLDLPSGRTRTFSGDITDSQGTGTNGNLSFVKQGFGTQVLSGANTFRGGTTINAGKLVLDFTSNNTADSKLNATKTLTFGGSTATLEMIGANSATPSSQAVSATTLGTGFAAGVMATSGSSGNVATLNLNTITRNTASTLDVSGTGLVKTNNVVSSYGLLDTGTTAGNRAAFATFGKSAFATRDVNGNIVAFASTVAEDASAFAANAHVTNQSNSFSNAAPAMTIRSLRFDAPVASTLTVGSGNTLVVATGGILVTPNVGANESTITGGTGLSAAGGGEYVIQQHNTQGELVIETPLTSGALTKAGEGTAVLKGNNTYAGITYVTRGILQVTGSGSLGSTAGSTTLYDGGTLEFKNSVGGTSEFTPPAEPITLTGAGRGYNGMGALYASGGITRYSGTISISSGSGDSIGVKAGSEFIYTTGFTQPANAKITKLGAGTLTFTAATGFNGSGPSVTIEAGTVKASGNGSLSAAIITASNRSTLVLDNTGTNNLDRFSGLTTLNSSDIVYYGNADADSTESVAKLVASGQGMVDIQHGGTKLARVGFSHENNGLFGITRSNNGTLLVRGNDLGKPVDNAAGRSALVSNTTPTGITQTGSVKLTSSATVNFDPSTKNYAIAPWIIAQDGTTGDGNTFATYDQATVASGFARGFIPLTDTNYETGISTNAVSTNNVRLTVADTVTASKTINSLVVVNSSTSSLLVDGAGPIVITSGGLLTPGSGDVSITAPVQSANEAIVHVTGAGKLTLGNILNGSAGLAKSGPGTLVLTGTGTTTAGAVNVNNGTMLINATGAAGSGAVAVRYGATLGGIGSTAAAVTVDKGGILSPGQSAGTLAVGGLNLNSGANFVAELGASADRLNVTGNVNLNYDQGVGGNLVLGSAPAGGTYYLVVNDGSDAVYGEFAGLAEGVASTLTFNNSTYTVTAYYGADYNSGSPGSSTLSGGNDLAIVVVPEPTAFGLLGLAGLGVLSRRHRRTK